MPDILTPATVEEQAEAYRGIRARVRAICNAAPSTAFERPCAPTPTWRARDVLAHLVGVPADILAGRMDGVATDAWTQAQVDGRRDTPVTAMLDAWDADGEQVEAIMAHFPPTSSGQMVYDATTHEHDLRHALGACGAHGSDAVRQSFAWLVNVTGRGRTDPLRLHTEAGEVLVGRGAPVADIGITTFEFMRAAAGRRSAAQIAAYDWHGGEPQPELLLAAPIFALAATDIVE